MAETILVVDDESSMRRFFEVTLKREGYVVVTADSVASGIAMLDQYAIDLILSDIRLGDGLGLAVLAASKEKDPDIPVIMMTAYASAETAVEAMKLGAADYLTKPFNVDEVRVVVRNNIRTRNILGENRKLKKALEETKPSKMVVHGERMRSIMKMLHRVSKMDTTILVTGESGTGKEMVMRSIHDMSQRADAPFISVNCGALPESLFESELFGYEKGAFTGAEKQRIGLFESAKGGTIFLDEIGEMPLKMQIKLLRVLQEKCIRRVGGTEEIAVDFRLLAATNRDLKKEVEENRFREDLYYRINVVPVHLPPLRERKEDILPLVKHFLNKFSGRLGEKEKELEPEVLVKIESHTWPGNVRELENTIERIVALTPGDTITVDNLPVQVQSAEADTSTEIYIPANGMNLEDYLDDLRIQYMKKSMDMSGGVQTKACELLGMSFRSFRYYLSKAKEKGYI